ncbi:MAG: universal stress protein [Proteobacteria bacterium]|nr:universal stress protein [Pseudomonadota bacterium]
MFPEVKIKKILYATDLSEYARKAFAYAVSLASKYDASITILHTIIDAPNIYSSALGYVGKEKWEEIKNEHMEEARGALIGKKRENVPIREILTHFYENAKQKFEDQPFMMDEIVITKGNPVEEILRQSEERNCDLIVMGSHGHGGILDAMIGSISQKVLRRSKKSVFLVRLPEK